MSVGQNTHRCGPRYPQREPVVVAFPRHIAASLPFFVSNDLSVKVQGEPKFVRADSAHDRIHSLLVLVVMAAKRVVSTPAQWRRRSILHDNFVRSRVEDSPATQSSGTARRSVIQGRGKGEIFSPVF